MEFNVENLPLYEDADYIPKNRSVFRDYIGTDSFGGVEIQKKKFDTNIIIYIYLFVKVFFIFFRLTSSFFCDILQL